MSSTDSIETSAPTIDQAIGQALAQLGAEQDDVTIEVLSTPRSGVLGLGARPARVRVTRRAPAAARSGVTSPPPAPPLRPTTPEMRRTEPRVAPPRDQRPAPRPERSEPAPAPPREDLRPAAAPPIVRSPAAETTAPDRHRERDAARESAETGPREEPRDDQHPPQGQGRPDGRRSRRGRGRGRGRGGSAEQAGAAAGGREPATVSAPDQTAPRETAPPERDFDHDEDRDPFALLDESGDDSRPSADLQEQAREARSLLERILDLMGERAAIEQADSEDPETLELNIKGDGSGLLIGRHGQTLDAIEYMVNRLLARKFKDAAPISIDTESYRARRRRLLQRMALSKGEQAKREHIAVTLDPMPPRDRRIVHLALKDDPMISTHSTGDGFMRAVEIVPVGERRDPNERNRDNRGRGRSRVRESDRNQPAIGEQGGFKHGQKRIV